jgi:hypothetical protein
MNRVHPLRALVLLTAALMAGGLMSPLRAQAASGTGLTAGSSTTGNLIYHGGPVMAAR